VRVVATAPGRVNLIGDHTDTTGGWCLPMAIDLATVVEGERGGDAVVLESDAEPGRVVVPLDVTDPGAVEPGWGRYVAGVVAETGPAAGFTGTVRTALPVGAGLASSAALEVAVALALGFDDDRFALARACQRAEADASGVPCGVMDQLTIAIAVAGHALLLDTETLGGVLVPIPDGVEIVAVHTGEPRALAGSAYASRRREVEHAETIVGPLRDAAVEDLDAIHDAVVRRRARHVVTENARVRDAAVALGRDDAERVGALMVESHVSLRDDFQVSTPALDALVARLLATPGVFGARLTGAGFGGCAVALTRPGAIEPGPGVWHLRPSGAAGVRMAC
jgi:galactokinase